MKILIVSTITNTINAFLIPHIKMLINEGHVVNLAAKLEQPISPEIKSLNCEYFEIPFDRNPISRSNYYAYQKLKKLIIRNEFDLIHTHTPNASAIVRLVCMRLPQVKVIYTAHGFHFYKGAPLLNWLTYFPIEYYLSRHTDALIILNNEDLAVARRMKAKQVFYIPGIGLDFQKIDYQLLNTKSKTSLIGFDNNTKVLLSVGELNSNKNHEIVIKALSLLKRNDYVYVICGDGGLKDNLKKLVFNLNLSERVLFMGYRTDVFDFYSISDIFIFPSLREGLSMSIMEAMYCKIPIICSDIRGNSDLVDNGMGGYRISSNDLNSYATYIDKLLDEENMRKDFGIHNFNKIENFKLELVLSMMSKVYKSIESNP